MPAPTYDRLFDIDVEDTADLRTKLSWHVYWNVEDGVHVDQRGRILWHRHSGGWEPCRAATSHGSWPHRLAVRKPTESELTALINRFSSGKRPMKTPDLDQDAAFIAHIIDSLEFTIAGLRKDGERGRSVIKELRGKWCSEYDRAEKLQSELITATEFDLSGNVKVLKVGPITARPVWEDEGFDPYTGDLKARTEKLQGELIGARSALDIARSRANHEMSQRKKAEAENDKQNGRLKKALGFVDTDLAVSVSNALVRIECLTHERDSLRTLLERTVPIITDDAENVDEPGALVRLLMDIRLALGKEEK